jgi:hypothetical protein
MVIILFSSFALFANAGPHVTNIAPARLAASTSLREIADSFDGILLLMSLPSAEERMMVDG